VTLSEIPNSKIPAYRQAGKCQMNVKFQKQKFLTFELWILFELDSPSVHHFVRALSFDIAFSNNILSIECSG